MKRIVMIAAVAENNVIGNDNQLLWRLPSDFKRFKAITSGHNIIMGRKTFESLPGLLTNRTHIVITRDQNYNPTVLQDGHKGCNVIIVNSLQEAIDLCPNNDTSYIIGGGEIYSQGMEIASELDITRVHASFIGDTYFPNIDSKIWSLTAVERNWKDQNHEYDYTFCRFERL
jgi:dihydrofolate reductase